MVNDEFKDYFWYHSSSQIGQIRRMILDGIIPAEKFGHVNMIKKSDAQKVQVYGKKGRPKKK